MPSSQELRWLETPPSNKSPSTASAKRTPRADEHSHRYEARETGYGSHGGSQLQLSPTAARRAEELKREHRMRRSQQKADLWSDINGVLAQLREQQALASELRQSLRR